MKIKKGFEKRKIGNRYIVITTGELSKKLNVIIEMNDTSSDIWDCLDKGMSIEQTAQALCGKYDISLEKATSDTEKLVEQMKQAGIFEE